MKVAIVGSRTFLNRKSIEVVIQHLLKDDPELVIVSGGAHGADTIAEQLARQLCTHAPVVLPADWQKHGRAAGPKRNQQIVDYCDRLVCFWDGASRGSADAVRRSIASGKPTHVFHAGLRRWLEEDELPTFFRPAQLSS